MLDLYIIANSLCGATFDTHESQSLLLVTEKKKPAMASNEWSSFFLFTKIIKKKQKGLYYKREYKAIDLMVRKERKKQVWKNKKKQFIKYEHNIISDFYFHEKFPR